MCLLLSIVFCLLLMLGLPLETWIRFFVWLIIGLTIYFTFGRRASRLSANPAKLIPMRHWLAALLALWVAALSGAPLAAAILQPERAEDGLLQAAVEELLLSQGPRLGSCSIAPAPCSDSCQQQPSNHHRASGRCSLRFFEGTLRDGSTRTSRVVSTSKLRPIRLRSLSATSAFFELVVPATIEDQEVFMRSNFHLLLRSAICLSAIVAELPAQQAVTSATLGGRVEDTSGAPVSGAHVEARDLGRGRALAQTTDAHGRFQFLYLNPGDYVLAISGPGFGEVKRTLTLALSQALDATFTLPVADRQDSVQVEGHLELLESAKTQTSHSITPTAVDGLPLNGRNYLDLALLAPGVSRANTGCRSSSPRPPR